MTTPSTPRKAGPLLGTGAQTSWPFTFKVFAASDIAVTIANNLGVETALVLNTDYSVSVNANQDTSPGGTVTYPLSGSPLPVGSKLTIIGNLPYDQPLDLPSGGNFSPLALENELDRLTMQIQQLRELTSRSLQLPVTATTTNVTLPQPQASNIIGWNESGSNLENYPLTELATSLAFATYRYDTFTGNGVTTQFTLSADPVTLGNLDVAISGVTQVPGTDYTLTNGVLQFTSAPANGTVILARFGEGVASGPSMDSYDVRFKQAGTSAVTRTAEAKMREWVSVKDFGATGDGVTDDLQAIQDAIDFCATSAGTNNVYFPPGDYYISGTLDLKVAVSLIGPGKSLVATAPYARIKGAGGSQTLLKYTGSFGSEARISLSIRGLQFTNCQTAIHLLGAAYWDITDCVFAYIRGSVSHAAIVLEDAILGVVEKCLFFFCACGIRGDTGLQYHVSIRDNDFNVDTGTGLPGPGYQAFGVLLRCDSTNIGFGPINIEDNNFIPAGSPGTNQTYGLVVACRGSVLNIKGNTFEALPQGDVVVTPIDPITSANHTADASGFWVRGGAIHGNWHVDGASGSASSYCYSLQYASNLSFVGNYLNPQTSVTGRAIVLFNTGSTKNTWSGENLIIYKSGYTGAGVEETNSTYGTNIIVENTFIDSTVDGPAWQNIKSGYLRLAPQNEFAGRLAQFGTANEGVEWMSSVSKRKMLVLSDGSAAIQARQSIETSPTYTNPTTTITLNGTERTLRFYTGGTVQTINGALYDGQILSMFNSSVSSVTLNESGNLRIQGGTSLVLAEGEGATFVWYSGGSYWAQI
jgi:hypothetical protein